MLFPAIGHCNAISSYHLLSARIGGIGRVIVAIRKHIVPEIAVAGAGVGVRVDEPSQGGVVVAGLQIVEARLGNAALSSKAKEVDFDSRGNRDLSQELI